MKMFIRLTFIMACLFFCNLLFAQKKSVTGYYITPQSDTVKGVFTNYTQWNKNPSEVAFVVAGATKPIQLTPQNVDKFVVEGYDEYLSYTGQRLINPIDDDVLLNEGSFFSLNDSNQQVVTFLRLVTRTIGGDLYVLNDAKRTNFFYQLGGQPITELRYKRAFTQNQFSNVADYRQQLNIQFAEIIAEKKLTSRLEQLPYMEEQLSSFFRNMFPTAKQVSKKQSDGTAWVISGGAALNMVSVHADKSFNSVPRTYGSSYSPLLSIGFIVPVGRNFGKYFFYPQVKLFRYKNTGEENNGTIIKAVTFQSDVAAVAQISGGINLVNGESFRFFLSGGFGVLGQVGGKQVKQLYAASDRSPYLNATYTKLPTFTYAIDASVGVELNNKLRFSATYMVPTNIGNFAFYEPRLSGVQVRVGYKLKG